MKRATQNKWGYSFGADGVVDLAEARLLLACCKNTVLSLAARDLIRKGIHKGTEAKSGKAVICRRSISLYLQSIEQGAGQ